MAVYTHVPDEALTEFLSLYDLPAPTVFKGIAEGVENSNYLLETAGKRFILTLYEKRVAKQDLPYFLDLMKHVMDAGVPAAGPIADTQGNILQTLCDRPAALIEFLSGTSPQTPTPKQAIAAGTAMAQMHLATADFSGDRANALGPAGWAAMIEALGQRLDSIEPGLEVELNQLMTALIAEWPRDLPRGTIHADLFPDNVLFSGDTIGGVIDFYFSCTDFYAYDLAISMNAWTEEGQTDPTVAQAFREGYETIRPLSADEANALPVLLKGAALRFLLTRAHDFLHQVPGSLVRVKDPLPYLALLRHHRNHPGAF